MLFFLLACSPTQTVVPSSDTAVHDTAQPSQHGDTAQQDGDDTVEQVPGVEGQVPGMCTMTLVCDGPIVDEPKVGCDFTVVSDSGQVQYSGRAGVDLRGRSSSVFPKPQYAAELWADGDQQDVSANLMGMGQESDWILNGAHIDRVLFRNRFAYDSFQLASADNYGPQSAACTLTLGDQWVGIYVLTERIKRDDDRVDIPSDDSGESFVIKLDDEDGIADNAAGYGRWQMVYPRSETLSATAQERIYQFLTDWQNALMTGSGDLSTYIDMDSAIDFVLVQEMTRNNDAYYLSVHLSRAPGEPMRFIPWDSDLSLGQPSYNDNENPAGWVAYRPTFIAALATHPGFHDRLVSRWRELREGVWSDHALNSRMDGYRAEMGDVVYDNFEVWPIDEITFGWNGENYLYSIDSYDAEHARVREWTEQRLIWMDENIETW